MIGAWPGVASPVMTAATRSQSDGLFNAAIGALERGLDQHLRPARLHRPPDTEQLRLPATTASLAG